jgi:hypothetical protein
MSIKRTVFSWARNLFLDPAIGSLDPLSRRERQFVDFVIGIDKEDGEVTCTSNEEHLANYFGKNPGAPYYLTPAFSVRMCLPSTIPSQANTRSWMAI